MSLDITIVTTVWGDYGRYLPAWADSIAAQTVLPAAVVVADCGADDIAPGREALKGLRKLGIKCRTVKAEHGPIGAMRNTAVASSKTEWVMHLDADDTLLPTALEDVEARTGDADVVAIGALRNGKPVLFTQTSTRYILSGRQGAMSPSAFRRECWQQRPFITENDWIESAFWVGLAHLGARFVGTPRPGFVYHQHADSHSHQLPAADKRAARDQHLRLCHSWDL